MTVQQTFVPFSVSKTPEERAEYVKANPQKYMPKAQYDIIKSIKDSIEALDSKVNQILAKK